jgi:hypothetical protein
MGMRKGQGLTAVDVSKATTEILTFGQNDDCCSPKRGLGWGSRRLSMRGKARLVAGPSFFC